MTAVTGPTGKIGSQVPTGYKSGQMQQFTPEQMELFKSLFGQVGPDSFLAKLAGGDQSLFEQMEKPALKQFAGLQGGLASKFSGMGMGGRRSSGFANTMSSAASDFAQQLQANRLGLQQQAIKDLLGMSTDLLGQKPYETFLMEKEKPFWQKLLGGVLKAGGTAAGAYFGGPAGAQAGYAAGSGVSEGFGL